MRWWRSLAPDERLGAAGWIVFGAWVALGWLF